MAAVIIGVDPHKGSHTAVAIDGAEAQLGSLRVRASAAPGRQAAGVGGGRGRSGPGRSRAPAGWGICWPSSCWPPASRSSTSSPSSAPGSGCCPPGQSNKNDPNDARSVAVAALRSPVRRVVIADDHPVVLKMWSKRHRDLARLRCQAACRLHAVLCEITPGGVPRAITAAAADALLRRPGPGRPVAAARHRSPPSTPLTCASSTTSCATHARRSPPRSAPAAPP